MRTKITYDHDYAEQELFLARHGLPEWETHLLAFCTNVKITDDEGKTLGYVWYHDILDTGSLACMVHACIIDKRAWSRRLVRFVLGHIIDEGFQMIIGEIRTPQTKKVWESLGANVSGDMFAFLEPKDLRIR